MSMLNPTHAVTAGEGVNIEAVDAALKSVGITGLSGLPELRQFPSGASNLTYALIYPERQLVLRRPPEGAKPKSGHDMGREARIMKALNGLLAVPEVLFYTSDLSITGAEFYVMEHMEGHVIHAQIPPEWHWTRVQTARLCENFFQTLVHLHQIDYKAIGLADFGRPEGYVERQVSGWERRFHRVITDNIGDFSDVRTWLETYRPRKESGFAIVHGDYRIDNCILDTNDPTRINAILDWEISALGDPIMDLGNVLSYWIEADDPPEMQMMVRQPSHVPGMMRRQEIVDFYAARTGADMSHIHFFYVFGLWRLAVIIQQIYYRYHMGQTTNPRFKDYYQMTNALGRLARDKIASGVL